MDTDLGHLLFVARTHVRPVQVGPVDARTGSRVGGAPPVSLAASPPTCPVCGGTMEYVLTLASDLLTDEVAHGKALSVLVCRDPSCRVKAFDVLRPSSLLLVAHEDEERAPPGSALEGTFEGRQLLPGELRPAADATCDDSYVGGKPDLIQPRGAKQIDALEKEGFAFVVQWAEAAIPRTMKRGTYPFGFGNALLFLPLHPDTRIPELRDPVGFWQTG